MRKFALVLIAAVAIVTPQSSSAAPISNGTAIKSEISLVEAATYYRRDYGYYPRYRYYGYNYYPRHRYYHSYNYGGYYPRRYYYQRPYYRPHYQQQYYRRYWY